MEQRPPPPPSAIPEHNARLQARKLTLFEVLFSDQEASEASDREATKEREAFEACPAEKETLSPVSEETEARTAAQTTYTRAIMAIANTLPVQDRTCLLCTLDPTMPSEIKAKKYTRHELDCHLTGHRGEHPRTTQITESPDVFVCTSGAAHLAGYDVDTHARIVQLRRAIEGTFALEQADRGKAECPLCWREPLLKRRLLGHVMAKHGRWLVDL